MNPHLIKTLFKNATPSVLAANAHDYGDGKPHEDNTRPARVSDPKPQRDKATALDAAVQGEAPCDGRITVRFVGYRVRPLDPDNFAGSVKDLLDGLRHAGLLPGDEPFRIRLETEQVRVRSFAEEKTVIEILTPALTAEQTPIP